MDLFSLTGKRILVTGGTRGIGRAISLRFARAGASIIANYVRDEVSAQDLMQMAQSEGLSIEVCRADLTGQKGLGRLEDSLGEGDGILSGMVFSSATGVHGSVDEITTRHFDWTFALNVRAFLEITKLLLPRFAEDASIVALSSEGAVHAMPAYSLVGSSKAALESLCRHLAVELAPKGIRVNILSPGAILTDAWDKMPDKEKRLAAAAKQSPTGRLCTAEEVARAAQFLCSEASSGIVGHTLVVDGGARIVG
jgi:NAD(P)-dependent dehydrogenase (short-subunit alcohol dehydrogenase family)